MKIIFAFQDQEHLKQNLSEALFNHLNKIIVFLYCLLSF